MTCQDCRYWDQETDAKVVRDAAVGVERFHPCQSTRILPYTGQGPNRAQALVFIRSTSKAPILTHASFGCAAGERR